MDAESFEERLDDFSDRYERIYSKDKNAGTELDMFIQELLGDVEPIKSTIYNDLEFIVDIENHLKEFYSIKVEYDGYKYFLIPLKDNYLCFLDNRGIDDDDDMEYPIIRYFIADVNHFLDYLVNIYEGKVVDFKGDYIPSAAIKVDIL